MSGPCALTKRYNSFGSKPIVFVRQNAYKKLIGRSRIRFSKPSKIFSVYDSIVSFYGGFRSKSDLNLPTNFVLLLILTMSFPFPERMYNVIYYVKSNNHKRIYYKNSNKNYNGRQRPTTIKTGHTRPTVNSFVRKKKDFNVLFCSRVKAANFTGCVIDVTDWNSKVIYITAAAEYKNRISPTFELKYK